MPALLQFAEVEMLASSPQSETPPAKKTGLVPPPAAAPVAETPEPLPEVGPSIAAESSMLPPEALDAAPEEAAEPAPSEVPQLVVTLTPAPAIEQAGEAVAAALEESPSPLTETRDPAPKAPALAATSSEWSRLAGPPAYPSPNMPDAPLSQSDLARAIRAIGDLGFFFSKLADTDPNPLAQQVWRSMGQAYTAAESALEAALQQGHLRLSDEAPVLAVQRRGDTFVVAMSLADDWAAPVAEESESREDGWPNAASLASHLIGAWIERDPAQSAAWFERHVTAAGTPSSFIGPEMSMPSRSSASANAPSLTS